MTRLTMNISTDNTGTILYGYTIHDDEKSKNTDKELLRRELFLKLLQDKPNHNIKENMFLETDLSNLNLENICLQQCEVLKFNLDGSTIKNSYFAMQQSSLNTKFKGDFKLINVCFAYGNLYIGDSARVFDNCYFKGTRIWQGKIKAIKNSSLIDVNLYGVDVNVIENCNLKGLDCSKEILQKVKNCYNVPKYLHYNHEADIYAYGDGKFKVVLLKKGQSGKFDIHSDKHIFDQTGKFVNDFYVKNKFVFEYLDFETVEDTFDLDTFFNTYGIGGEGE